MTTDDAREQAIEHRSARDRAEGMTEGEIKQAIDATGLLRTQAAPVDDEHLVERALEVVADGRLRCDEEAVRVLLRAGFLCPPERTSSYQGGYVDGQAAAEAEVAKLRDERDQAWKVVERQERTIEGYENYPVDGAEIIAADNARLRAERDRAVAERDELGERLSILLCELTGGCMSKTNYDVPTMVSEIEAYFERTIDDDANRAVTDLAALRDRVRELADEAPSVPVHVGGGNLVSRQRMVKADELRALLDGGGDSDDQ